jgi:UDP-N-acetylglucosamine transferase subunit ALG13
MIFVTVGSQKFQFDRLLQEIDRLIENKIINEDVIAQIGFSTYIPKNYKYYKFIDQDQFKKYISKCDMVITHAGTGAIVGALKQGKKVVAVPRLAKYGEHVDDHQIQLLDEFKELNFIEPAYDVKDLEKAIEKCRKSEYNTYVSNTKNVIEDIEKFIE